MKIDLKKAPKVEVEWDDAESDSPGWKDVDAVVTQWEPPAATTTGYLIQANEKQVKVAGSFCKGDVQNSLVIPRSCVKAVWLLERIKRLKL